MGRPKKQKAPWGRLDANFKRGDYNLSLRFTEAVFRWIVLAELETRAGANRMPTGSYPVL
jgi:hypothetical protein